MDSALKIITLNKVAFLLFIIPFFALVLSILSANLFYSFDYHYYPNFYKADKIEFECNKSNNYCLDLYLSKSNKIDGCSKYYIGYHYQINDEIIAEDDDWRKVVLNSENKNKKLQKIFHSNENIINQSCFKNSELYKYNKYFGYIFEGIGKLRNSNKYTAATSETINPFVNGETSISNIVKRFPTNFIFKPLMYITVIIMIIYWILNNKIFNQIIKSKKTNLFLYFGILSAIFLFFHVLLLGSNIENELFQKIRRTIIVLFILFEVLGQIFLTKNLYTYKNNFYNYARIKIIFLKVIFVSLVLLVTLFVFFILTFYNLPSKIDYILEWNYFAALLIYYFLSSIMWKNVRELT